MHTEFMKFALEEAYQARGICAPNPSVGALIVHNNQIIARAHHQGAGSDHAEQRVLQLLPTKISGATLYVTLEPCNHWGKTPPCVSAIIDSGIQRVVYGYSDPNPIVIANNTSRILQEQGIEVIHFPLPEIDEFYRSYQFWTDTKKPFVTAKIAHTLDGRIGGIAGKTAHLSNEYCRNFTHTQRLQTDVILTTARTIMNDDPLLNVRLDSQTISKPVAILDSRLSLTLNAKIFTTAKHCHIFHDRKLLLKNPQENCSYHPVPAQQGQLDLPSVIRHLGHLGFHDVWVEGGGRLFSALHEEELVQKTYLYIVPSVLGEQATQAYHGKNFFSRKHTISWQPLADNMVACLTWQEGECLPD